VVKDGEGLLMVESWGLEPLETAKRVEEKWRELGHPLTLGDVDGWNSPTLVEIEPGDEGKTLSRGTSSPCLSISSIES
jgi:hypothetical protein